MADYGVGVENRFALLSAHEDEPKAPKKPVAASKASGSAAPKKGRVWCCVPGADFLVFS